jgi:hypothetical protein
MLSYLIYLRAELIQLRASDEAALSDNSKNFPRGGTDYWTAGVTSID